MGTKKKLLFVFNPFSGKAQIKNQLLDIVDVMVKADYEVTIYPTQAQGDAIHKIETEAGDYDLVVCSGGGGTPGEGGGGGANRIDREGGRRVGADGQEVCQDEGPVARAPRDGASPRARSSRHTRGRSTPGSTTTAGTGASSATRRRGST